jgi:hypothetical protein
MAAWLAESHLGQYLFVSHNALIKMQVTEYADDDVGVGSDPVQLKVLWGANGQVPNELQPKARAIGHPATADIVWKTLCTGSDLGPSPSTSMLCRGP